MRTVTLFIAALLLSPPIPMRTAADEPATTHDKTLNDLPIVSGYYGGLPFYTAFHQSMTTRLLLLKRANDILELKQYLNLSESQLARIKTLQIGRHGQLSDRQRSTLLDENIAVDEDLIETDFYGFLDDAQQESLDRLAFEFDGLAGLTRTSIARRIGLSSETRDVVAKTLVSFRKRVWLPYFRYEFAARLPADHEYRKCVFVGEYLLGLNQAIIGHLSVDERRAYANWISQKALPDGLIEAIKLKAPLPEGLFALGKPSDG